MTTPTPNPYRALAPARRALRRSLWSTRSVLLLALIDAALVAILVFTLGHKSLFAETQLALSLISLTFFLFLAIGLYRGVRLRHEYIEVKAPAAPLSYSNSLDFTNVDLGNLTTGGDSLVGCLVNIIIAIVVVLVLSVLLVFLINIAWVAIGLLAVALYYLLHRALRQIFIHTRVTRGNLPKSLAYALLYTALYTGWLIALVGAFHFLHARHAPAPNLPVERPAAAVQPPRPH